MIHQYDSIEVEQLIIYGRIVLHNNNIDKQ